MGADPGLLAARRMVAVDTEPGDGWEPPPDDQAGRDSGLRPAEALVASTPTPAHKRYPIVDWQHAFAGARDEVEWLVPDFVARGQSYALVSTAKAGKSLLMLDVAAAIAAGRPALARRPQPPARVLYVDHENTGFDVIERLRDMGYTPGDLGNLRYLSFPTMPPLDGPAGGIDLVEVAEHHDAALIVIDTVTRVVAGEENSADTYRALYRNTLAPLKGAGRAVVRLDHRGHGVKTTARGSSAKADDLDAVWMLDTAPGGEDGDVLVNLGLERQRGNAHPDRILLLRQYDPHLRHIIRPKSMPDAERRRIGERIDAMIQLRLPVDTGARRAREALRLSGYKVRNDIVAAAVKERKSAVTQADDAVQEELT
ncbi:AAA family ATPase [Mycolicibacterium septicum]|uniref:AAA family ATPase n=1 Tax=Mycolicibacterium septicum TaxID=98668 RepID=UPI0023E3267C|nr:AAA family ATPase [Mycolicibacterium septicum]MDF3342101.1 AAA family ATPase [Mycolicibacterium septicum]